MWDNCIYRYAIVQICIKADQLLASPPASQPASLIGCIRISQPASHPGRQPASQAGSQPVRQQMKQPDPQKPKYPRSRGHNSADALGPRPLETPHHMDSTIISQRIRTALTGHILGKGSVLVPQRFLTYLTSGSLWGHFEISYLRESLPNGCR